MNRRLLTVLLPLAAASLVAGCSTFSDADAVARVGDQELSTDQLDQLLTDQQVPDDARNDLSVVRPAISNWIRETAIDTGLFSNEAVQAIPETDLLALYRQGLAVSGVSCINLLVAPSVEEGVTARKRLEAGEDFAVVFADVNIDEQLASVDGEAGCFDRTQFESLPELTPEIEALFSVTVDDQFATAPTPNADGSTGALVLAYRDLTELPDDEQANVYQLIRDTSGPGLVVSDIDIYVASRYGRFDAASAQVVPLG